MRRRLGPVGWVLLVFAILVGVALLRGGREQEPLPAGSSLSAQPTGARALFLWLEAAGARTQRLQAVQGTLRGRPDTLLVIQPAFPVLPITRTVFDDVPARGGTLVLVGDSGSLQDYAARFDVHLGRTPAPRTLAVPVSVPAAAPGASAPQGTSGTAGRPPVRVSASHRIERADGATPLLVTPERDWIAVRKPYRGGTLVVLSSYYPLSNEGLHDPATARFVYQEIIAPALPSQPSQPAGTSAGSHSVAFDETHRNLPGGAPAAGSATQLLGWVLRRPGGGAAAYAVALVFVYLLLSGRRLGPALRPVAAGGASRTMYEHVQALAGLYQRARQLPYLRQFYAHHYRRLVARAIGTDAPTARPGPLDAQELASHGLPPDRAAAVAEAVARIETSGSERQLVEAVRLAGQTVGVPLTPLTSSASSASSASSVPLAVRTHSVP